MVMLHELEHLPNTLNHIQHPPQCLFLAQSGHCHRAEECPLSGVKQSASASPMPKRCHTAPAAPSILGAGTRYYAEELLSLALAHAVSDKVEAAYRRGLMLAKRQSKRGMAKPCYVKRMVWRSLGAAGDARRLIHFRTGNQLRRATPATLRRLSPVQWFGGVWILYKMLAALPGGQPPP